jgi:hypothetical protein
MNRAIYFRGWPNHDPDSISNGHCIRADIVSLKQRKKPAEILL